MTTLAKRIKELRLSENMTQDEFGKKFGIVKSTVSLYENGNSTPNDDIKMAIADYFGVTLDYLLGRSDIRNPYDSKKIQENIEEKDPLDGLEIAAHKKDSTKDFTYEQKEFIADLVNKAVAEKIKEGKENKNKDK